MSDSQVVAAPAVKARGPGRPPKGPTPKGAYIPSGKPRGRPKISTEVKSSRIPLVERRGRPKAPPKTHAPFSKLVPSAVEALYEKKGVSKVAVVKYIMANEPECADKIATARSVRTALKGMVKREILVAPKGIKGKFKWAAKVNKDYLKSKKEEEAPGKTKVRKSLGKPAKGSLEKATKPGGGSAATTTTTKKKAANKSVGSAAGPKKALGRPKKVVAAEGKRGRGRPPKIEVF